jgi:DNA modification methylase
MEINSVINGGALDILRKMESDSVDCCISSPPYYGLRDYGVEGQLGLEKTFQEYLDKLIEIYAEVKRVIKPSGSIWVNLGDSYYGGGRNSGNTTDNVYLQHTQPASFVTKKWGGELPDKCLINIPGRFAIKMTDELGLIQRNEIVWYKRNCMPSSAKDRFTVDFEKIYFFTKSKKYYFEQIYEPYTLPLNRWGGVYTSGNYENSKYRDEDKVSYPSKGRSMRPNEQGRNKRCVWDITTKPYKEAHFATFPEDLVKPMIQAGSPKDGIVLDIFAGSGTTLKVAKELGRNYIGIELNAEYIPLINKRIDSIPLKLAI